MFFKNKESIPSGDVKSMQVGIVQSKTNLDVTSALYKSCHSRLLELGLLAKNIDTFEVPGALEIPIALQGLAEAEEYDVLIALGCIVRGETFHFELIARECASGITRVSLDYQTPVINAVLATDTREQAISRQESKGQEAADAAIQISHCLTTMES